MNIEILKCSYYLPGSNDTCFRLGWENQVLMPSLAFRFIEGKEEERKMIGCDLVGLENKNRNYEYVPENTVSWLIDYLLKEYASDFNIRELSFPCVWERFSNGMEWKEL